MYIKDLIMYHGTDARMVEMTREERMRYKADCELVIDYLYPYFKPIMKQEMVEATYKGSPIFCNQYVMKRYKEQLNEKEPYLYINLLEKLQMIEMRNNGIEKYQYKDLYLTQSKMTARSYAQRSYAGGETGLLTYRLISGAEVIGFENMNPDANVKKAIERIKEFAKEGNERPVIITIEGIDTNDLENEDGKPLESIGIDFLIEDNSVEDNVGSYRYKKDVELKNFKMVYLKPA